MSCKNIKTFRHTYNKLSKFSLNEEDLDNVWKLIEKEVLKGLETGWNADKKGNKALSGKSFQCANNLFYLLSYGLVIRNYNLTEFPTKLKLYDKFKIKCVEKNLQCLSANCGIDYVSIWKNIKEELGIYDLVVIPGEECCVGIGEAIIDDNDDCLAFIIGSCTEQTPLLGDFNDDFNEDLY